MRHPLATTLAFMMAAGFAQSSALAADKRKATINWNQTENAAKYDFQLSLKPSMDPVLERKTYEKAEAVLQLEAGTYYFRVRGIDSSEEPGPWSEVEGFVVNPLPPTLVSPAASHEFKTKIPDEGIEFKWKGGVAGSKYIFEVTDNNGSVLKRTVNKSSISWRPQWPGTYQWHVGFEKSGGNEEWSKPRSFSATKVAIEGEQKVIIKEVIKQVPTKTEEKKPTIVYVDRRQQNEKDIARPQEWSLIGRLAQAVVAYTVEDRDTGINASGAALVGLFSGELRWRGAKQVGQRWTYSAALNLEVIRQTVLNTSFTMPRGYSRFFVGRESGMWRFSPFVQIGGGQSGIFVVENETHARRGKVTRLNFGAGLAATYRASDSLIFSLLGLLRMDTGGTTDALPTQLSASPAFELGFGVGINLDTHWMIEGRLRLLQESFFWAPANGQANSSSLNNNFVILDGGVGFRF